MGHNAIQFTNNPIVDIFPFSVLAITFGNVINYGPNSTPTSVTTTDDGFLWVWLGSHEEQHTYQEELWGPLFLPAYLIAELLPGTNPFESAADRAAEVVGW